MFWCRMGGGLMGHVWVPEYPSSQLGMGCGGVGQNESGGVKQCIGHFYSFISFI